MQVVAVDIGGTHARFAIAEVEKGRVAALGEPITLKTAEHGSLQLAWRAAQRALGRPFPRAAGLPVASLIHAELNKLPNNPCTLQPDSRRVRPEWSSTCRPRW